MENLTLAEFKDFMTSSDINTLETPYDIVLNISTLSEYRQVPTYAKGRYLNLTINTSGKSESPIGEISFGSNEFLVSINLNGSYHDIEPKFKNCKNLKSFYSSNSTVIGDGVSMFYRCTSLTDCHVEYGITDCSKMFEGCTSLEVAPSINYSLIVNGSRMFFGCTKLNYINLENLSSLQNASEMFGETNLRKVVVKASELTNTYCMFKDCLNLVSVSFRSFTNSFSSLIFEGCNNLEDFCGDESVYNSLMRRTASAFLPGSIKKIKFIGVDPSNVVALVYRFKENQSTFFVEPRDISLEMLEDERMLEDYINPENFIFDNNGNLTAIPYLDSNITPLFIPWLVNKYGENIFSKESPLKVFGESLVPSDGVKEWTNPFNIKKGKYSFVKNIFTNSNPKVFDLSIYCDFSETVVKSSTIITINNKNDGFIIKAPSFKNVDITTMNRSFYGCNNLTSIPELSPSTSYVNEAFAECENLKTCFWIVSGTTPIYTEGMFRDCPSLQEVHIKNFDHIEYAEKMFSGCSSLRIVDIDNMENLKTALYMFENTSIETINLATLNKECACGYMFNNCKKLNSVDNWPFKEYYGNLKNMFFACDSVKINIPMNKSVKPSKQKLIVVKRHSGQTNYRTVEVYDTNTLEHYVFSINNYSDISFLLNSQELVISQQKFADIAISAAINQIHDNIRFGIEDVVHQNELIIKAKDVEKVSQNIISVTDEEIASIFAHQKKEVL